VIQFEQIKHERRGPNLEQKCCGQNTRVAMQQMKASILPRVSQRLIPRINNRAIELHPFEKVVIDVIGALADLKVTVRAMPQKVAA
jgi:hypothetical protein